MDLPERVVPGTDRDQVGVPVLQDLLGVRAVEDQADGDSAASPSDEVPTMSILSSARQCSAQNVKSLDLGVPALPD